MDETSPRLKKRAESLNARFLRQLATRSFSSPERKIPWCRVEPAIFQLVTIPWNFDRSAIFHRENPTFYMTKRFIFFFKYKKFELRID